MLFEYIYTHVHMYGVYICMECLVNKIAQLELIFKKKIFCELFFDIGQVLLVTYRCIQRVDARLME